MSSNLFPIFSFVNINVSSCFAGPLGKSVVNKGTAKFLRKSASPSSLAYILENQLQDQFTEYKYICY